MPQIDGSDDILCAGHTQSTDFDSQTNKGNYDVFVMKISSGGVHQWTVLHGGSANDYVNGLKALGGVGW